MKTLAVARVPRALQIEGLASRLRWAAAAGVYALVVATTLRSSSWEVAGAVLALHLLALPSAVLLSRALRTEPEILVRAVLVGALFAKLAGGLVRYSVSRFDLVGVGGGADAVFYAISGRVLSSNFLHGDFSLAGLVRGGRALGTGAIEVVTGIVFIGIGPSTVGGYLVFAWLSFVGLYLFTRALAVALPGGLRLRYSLLVFGLPSLLFWPSSIGKDAWMIFGLGLAAYGAARWFTRQPRGSAWLVAGLALTAVVRPHIALLVLAAVLVALVVGSWEGGAPGQLPLGRVALAAVLVVGCGLVLRGVQTYFSLGDLDVSTVTEFVDETREQTATGSSEFEPVPLTEVHGVPAAFITVLFRPLPVEADSAAQVLAGLESSLLLLMTIRWRRHIRGVLSARSPYGVFALAFTILFVLAFSSFANFGLLARQRSQVLPFFLVLLCAPLPPRRRERPGLEQLHVAQHQAPVG